MNIASTRPLSKPNFLFLSLFLLKCNWFTRLCQFLIYSKMIQSYILFFGGGVSFLAMPAACKSFPAREQSWGRCQILNLLHRGRPPMHYLFISRLLSRSLPGDRIEFPALSAGPHRSCILNAIVCTYQPRTPQPPHPLPSPSATPTLFSVSVSLSLFCR